MQTSLNNFEGMKTIFMVLSGVMLAWTVATIIFGFTPNGFTPKNNLSIDGVWSIVEVQTVKPNGTFSTTFPRESQAIFSKNYYSFCWTSHAFTVRGWQLADSIKLLRFNQSIINTGTFAMQDSTLSTKATFAMHPMFTDGLAKFKCTFVGDTLVLRGLSVFSSDNVSHPMYANGSYSITKLLKIRTK